MLSKPLLPEQYIIQDEVIKNRISRLLNIEVYKLESGKYLYLITDAQFDEVLPSKKSKHHLFWVKIGLDEYPAFISTKLSWEKIATFKKGLFSKIWFEAIAWMKELKDTLQKEIIDPLKNPEQYKKYKLPIPNWILFFWAPWCWKTFMSRKLAEEIWYNFYEIKHSDLSSPYIHETTGKIWEVFETAKQNAPSIVFFDEISWLVPRRDEIIKSYSYKEEEVNEFLIQLNDASVNNILVIWATNFPNKIDPAILRSWRLDKRIYIWLPDFEARKELFEMYLQDRPLEDIDFEQLAHWTWGEKVSKKGIWFTAETEEIYMEKFVTSDIQLMCDEFARKALHENCNITMDICKKVIEKFTPSVSQEDLNFYESFIDEYQRK